MSGPDQNTPLNITNLSVAQGRKPVFENLSLTMRAGEIFGLIGINGAGKTSLIKAALNLIEPEAGDVQFFGVPNRDKESRRNVSYLPENFHPPAALSGVEFLRMAMGFHNFAFDRTAANDLARAIDLDPAVLDRRIGALSKGMGQKLGLLAAFLGDCALLMLDEPMSGLDPRARILLKSAMQNYRARNKSIFMSLHTLSDLDELCDRVAVLHEGRLLFVGPPAELRHAHASVTLEQAFLQIIGFTPAGNGTTA